MFLRTLLRVADACHVDHCERGIAMMDVLDSTFWNGIFDTVWADMHQPAFWLGVLQIIWIDILLAGDNAVVIALACRNLPPRLRTWGMLLGAGVAVLMRILFTLVVSTLLTLPFLKLAGGVALIFIAVKLLTPEHTEEGRHVEGSTRLWQAVRIVALADIVMSLDNVIAIAAASKGNPVLFIFGLTASVPLIVAGAALVMSLLTRFPLLVWAGAALLGWIAGELIGTDPAVRGFIAEYAHAQILPNFAVLMGILGIVVVVGTGWWLRRRHSARLERSAAERA
jgi:YjbE family integral membrane protein